MPNRRISELDESGPLYFNDVSFNSIYTESASEGSSSDWFLMTANPKISNNKISIPNFQRSVLTDAMYLNGAQTISGEKIFKDKCYITKRANIHSIQDLSSEGPISGKTFVGTTGLFENTVAGTGENIPEGCSLTIFESATFEGKLKINNSLSFPGEFDTTGNFSALNFTVVSGAQIIEATSATGHSSFSENIHASGDLNTSGQISADTLYVHQNIFSQNNQQITFNDDHIHFTSGSSNVIDVADDNIQIKNKIYANNEHVINLSESTPSGMLHVDGTGYVENINALNDTTYRPFFGGDDESMIFKTQLRTGAREYTIDLPKTFHTQPILSTQLQHTGFIVPYILSDVTQNDFKIKFGQDIQDNNFVIHTTAMAASTGELSTNKKGFQRFTTNISAGSDTYTISFPEEHNLKPMVSVNIQAQNEIVPYTISGVSKNDYTLILSTQSTEDYTIHTISTEHETQRIS
jgi:hypothetical protein